MDPFVEQLKHLCAQHPTRSKWLFVPTHALGRTVGDRLVLEGTSWANLRFVTPLDIELRMAAVRPDQLVPAAFSSPAKPRGAAFGCHATGEVDDRTV